MNRRRMAIIITLVLAFTMCFGTTVSHAESLASLQKKIEEKQKELDKGKKEEKNLSEKVSDLEETLNSLEAKIATSEIKLKKLKKELKAAQDKVDKQNDELGGRLRNMYKNGSVGFLDVLLASNSFSEFLTNLDMVEIIYASDKDVLADLQKAHDEIKKKKQAVEKLQKELKASQETAAAEKKEVEAQKKEIAADNEEIARMLDRMEQEAQAVAAELAAQAQNGGTSSSSSSKYSGGVFTWPAPGYYSITSEYGYRMCPFHGREFHQGIDIGASSGASVLASASGVVISAGYRASFGNSIMVDHGGGIVTMYNHLSAINVGYGAAVSKGQVIGRVGSTGDSTGPHLDYRVFVDGVSQNPHNYF